MNDGRLRFTVPSPWLTHAPMLGRAKRHRAGVDAERGLKVVRVIVAHRTDEAQVVGALGDVRKEIADPQPRLAALLERPLRPFEIFLHHAIVRRERFEHALRHDVGAIVIGEQFRLVIERVDVRHAAAEVDEDDPFGPRLRNAAASGPADRRPPAAPDGVRPRAVRRGCRAAAGSRRRASGSRCGG